MQNKSTLSESARNKAASHRLNKEAKNKPFMEKTLLRPDEAAEILRVSRWTIYRWLAEGRIKGTRISKGTLRVFKESIDHLICQNELQFLSHLEELGASVGRSTNRDQGE